MQYSENCSLASRCLCFRYTFLVHSRALSDCPLCIPCVVLFTVHVILACGWNVLLLFCSYHAIWCLLQFVFLSHFRTVVFPYWSFLLNSVTFFMSSMSKPAYSFFVQIRHITTKLWDRSILSMLKNLDSVQRELCSIMHFHISICTSPLIFATCLVLFCMSLVLQYLHLYVGSRSSCRQFLFNIWGDSNQRQGKWFSQAG